MFRARPGHREGGWYDPRVETQGEPRPPPRTSTNEVATAGVPTSPLAGRSLPVYMALVLAGIAGNYFGAPLFFGLDFVFGSVFTLPLVQLYGPAWGTAGTLIAASATFFLWGHPWAGLVLVAEALFVGFVAPRLRNNLLAADGLYWIALGMPLVGLTYGLVLETSATSTLLVMLKQSVNGIFNALMASLLLTHTPLRSMAGVAEQRAVPLRQVMFELLVTAVLLPTLLVVMVGTRQDLRKFEQDLVEQLDATSNSLASRIGAWRDRNLWAIAQLSVSAAEVGMRAGPELDRATAQVGRTFPELHRLFVADTAGRVVARHPAIEGAEDSAARVLAVEPLASALRARAPAISPVYAGDGGGPRTPRVAMAAPVRRGNRVLGMVIGELEAAPLRELLRVYAPNPGARLTLTDDRDTVIASTSGDMRPMQPFRTEGVLRQREGGVFQRVPEEPGAAAITRWRNSLYGRRTFLGNPAWHLVVELPVAPVQQFLQERYLQAFGVMLAVCVLALLLGGALAAGLARPLGKLASATTDLPARLASGELPAWPRSRVAEVDSLARNFRSMAGALEARFQELTGTSAVLAQRSAELVDANRELEGEVAERRRAESALRVLAEAGSALAGSLDPGATLERTARICVPTLADWAVVALSLAGGETRYAVAHRESDAERRLGALAARLPGPLLEGGDALEEPQVVTDPLDWTVARTDVLGTLMREAGAASALLVPLRARGKTLGTLVLVRYADSAAYDAQTVHLAEELARRAALALDNAGLYGELREADRRKDEFLAMLAHELRNPLSPLATSVQLLRSGAPASVAERALSVMERQLGHIVRLVDDLLDVARVTRGRIELHREPLELGAAVAATAENLRPRFDERGQELTVVVPRAPLSVEADPTRLEQVVANLLSNANKYTARGGHVRVVVERDADEGVIRIHDDGIGMERDLLRRVFDLFMQSEQALDRSQGGLGIGLTLVRQLVELHGGSVQAHSDGPGKGSEFEVRLPLVASATEAVAAAPPRRELAPARPAGGARRVLVVDDNVEAADSLGELLRIWGHQVLVANDGPAGLVLAERERPDVILLDIGLPGLDGYEVGRRLRASATLRDVMLVAVTGYGEQVHDGRLEEIGFDHLLVKPVRPAELQELLGGRVGAGR